MKKLNTKVKKNKDRKRDEKLERMGRQKLKIEIVLREQRQSRMLKESESEVKKSIVKD